MNAFNSVSRNAVLEHVFERVPSPGPYAAFAYGTPFMLYVDGAPEGSVALRSSDRVRQGDPCGPLLFALALQLVLQTASRVHPDCSIVAYADDITLQGPQQSVECAFRHLRNALLPYRLCVNPAKCKLYSSNRNCYKHWLHSGHSDCHCRHAYQTV
jgi:Reverse transcriptase (RNA-dependent DNA polymerase)